MRRALYPVLLTLLAACPGSAPRPATTPAAETPTRPSGSLEEVDGINVWIDLRPTRPFDVVSSTSALCGATNSICPREDVLRNAAAETRSRGADAVIITSRSEPHQQQVAIQGGGGWIIRHSAEFIRYRGDAQAASTGQAASPPTVLYVPASEFTAVGASPPRAGARQPLTQAQTEELSRAIAAMPAFPRYLFSGCHDRAHAAYMLLPEALRAKADKVWLFAPSKYTSALRGDIGLSVDEPHTDQVAWGYHVALLFNTPQGDRVLDAALAPGTLIEIPQWFSYMKIPSPSFWTVLDGKHFLFNESGTPAFDPAWSAHRNTALLNGFFFDYDGTSAQLNRIPRSLARDAAGVELMAGSRCTSLERYIQKPDSLLSMLERPEQPAECASVKATFDREVGVWSQRLASTAAQ